MRLLTLFLFAIVAYPQSGIITTFAGAFPIGDGGSARQAALFGPQGLAFDAMGAAYISESGVGRVRKISPDGVITTVAGIGVGGYAGDGGPAVAARFSAPSSLAFDLEGRLLIADSLNHRIRRVSANGVVTTIAGDGRSGFTGDGADATRANLFNPTGLAVAHDGTIFFCDSFNHRVRRILVDGTIDTYFGGGSSGVLANGSIAAPDPANPLVQPTSLALAATGELFVSDSTRHRIFRIDRDRRITPFAGTGVPGFSGDGGPAILANVNTNGPIALDSIGNLYLTDNRNNRIRMVSPDGVIKTIAGDGTLGSSGDGGSALDARLAHINGLAWHNGQLFFCDSLTQSVRRIASDGQISRFAGIDALTGDGSLAAYARFINPRNVAVAPNGDILVVDGVRIRRISVSGKIETIAGTGSPYGSGDDGPAIEAGLTAGTQIAVDRNGNLYIGENGFGMAATGNRIRKIDKDGIITRVAGTGSFGFDGDGGPATSARLAGPGGVVVDEAGNLYIADTGNHRIRKVSVDGVISTIAGNGVAGFAGDGGPATHAVLNSPQTIALDAEGNVFIADRQNYRIRKISTDGIISTIAGDGRLGFAGDGGDSRNAALSGVNGIAVDREGNLFLADSGNSRIRKVGRNGVITTVAGNGSVQLSGDGGAATLAGLSPSGVAVDSNGVIYISDTGSSRIRKVEGSISYLAAPSALVFSTALGGPAQQRAVSLTVPDRVSRAFTVSALPTWLSATPTGGTIEADPAILTVTMNPVGLAKGSYSTVIRVSNPHSTSEFVNIGVILTVSGTPQQLRLSQTGLFFASLAGGPQPPPQSVRVLNTGIGATQWTASANTLAGGQGWLSVSPASGTSQANTAGTQVDVRVNPEGLAAGTYFGQVIIYAPGADNSPQSATIVLNVLPADRPPGPVVEPLGLLFTGSSIQHIQVSNVTARSLTMTSTTVFPDQRTWFTLQLPAGGSVLPGQVGRIEVRPAIQGIPAGTYRGTINLRFTPDNITTVVNLLLVIPPAPPAGADRATTAACVPKRLNPIFRSPGQGFIATASWPVPIEVQVVDDCGQPHTSGQVVVTFNSGDPPLALNATFDGRWSGTWAARNVRNSVTMIARATRFDPRLEATTQITGASRENPDQPLITPGGIVNGASRKAETPVSPGAAIAVVGAKMAREQQQAATLPLPAQIGETSMSIAGRTIPLRSVSEGRIEGIVPYQTPDSTVHQLIVRRGLALSLPEYVVVASSGPGVYAVDETGIGQGRVFVTNENAELVLADPSRPARAGERLTILCVGLGSLKAVVNAGEAAPSDPPVEVAATVRVTIQGHDAEVQSAVLAPGLAGVYQVIARIPDDIIPDANAALVVTVNGQSSPLVTVAVVDQK
jgi:uncharacterized protein (TIGR03437 family)